MECGYHILVLCKLLCGLAELLLCLEVLLEIEVAKVAADLYLVVEFLYVVLIGIVDVPEGVGGNWAGLSPAVLDLAECGEGVAGVAVVFHHLLEVLDDGLLCHEILFSAGVLLLVELCPFFLVVCVDGLEVLFYGNERIVDGRFTLGSFSLELAQELVECGFDVLCLFGAHHAVCALLEVLEHLGELGKGLVGKVLYLFFERFRLRLGLRFRFCHGFCLRLGLGRGLRFRLRNCFGGGLGFCYWCGVADNLLRGFHHGILYFFSYV